MNRFDYTDGDYLHNMGGGMMIDSEGHMMQDMGSGMALDMESGELHIMDSGMCSLFDDDEDDWQLVLYKLRVISGEVAAELQLLLMLQNHSSRINVCDFGIDIDKQTTSIYRTVLQVDEHDAADAV